MSQSEVPVRRTGYSFREGWSLHSAVLLPAAGLYALGWRAYRWIYESGLKKASHPHSPIVCIGNLRVGGTGKTPLTMGVARELLRRGQRVVIGCSGYGSPGSRSATLVPLGPLDPTEWGDEPAMIRDVLGDAVPLIVGRDRVRAAEIAADENPKSILLMDDGFQHLRLATDCSVVIDLGWRPALCLPAGPYREPTSGLTRASIVVDRRSLTTFFRLMDAHGDEVNPESFQGREIQIVTAIGQPWQFSHQLERLGMNVIGGHLLPDHATLSDGAWAKGLDPTKPLMITRKDWVKLRQSSASNQFEIFVGDYEYDAEKISQLTDQILTRINHLVEAPVAV